MKYPHKYVHNAIKLILGMRMKLFKAKDGSLINPNNVNLVLHYREEGSWVVKFDFGYSAREIIFNSEKEANEEIEKFKFHCDCA